jgi:hypothetical protein
MDWAINLSASTTWFLLGSLGYFPGMDPATAYGVRKHEPTLGVAVFDR